MKITTQTGRNDMFSAAREWRRSLWLARFEQGQKNRRTIFRSYWDTLSFALFVGALGVLYAEIMGHPVHEYLPYLASGLLCWFFILGVVADGCHVFVKNTVYIREFPLPLSTYVYSLVTVHAIQFCRNLFVVAIACLVCSVPWNVSLLWLPLGFVLLLLNGVFLILALGVISTRYRDWPQMIVNIMRVAFFMTPILWHYEVRPGLSWLVDINPFFHMIEMIREPLLGSAPSMLNVSVSLAITLLTMIVGGMLFHNFRNKIIFWL